MQVYAEDETGFISARLAEKRKNYVCPECKQIVRLRGGVERQSHFFHVLPNLNCRLAQKSLTHLRIQKFLTHLLQNEDAVMEKPFLEINRIADVACLKTNKIFEIQYSPISYEEAFQRCIDYESLGFELIWILHINSFGETKKMSDAEKFLRTRNCYFTNMDGKGSGEIYDQREELHGNIRKYWDPPIPIDLKKCFSIPRTLKLPPEKSGWTLYHKWDVIYFLLKGMKTEVFDPNETDEKPLSFKEQYMEWLYMLLERSSK